jgi:hypothetical protein
MPKPNNATRAARTPVAPAPVAAGTMAPAIVEAIKAAQAAPVTAALAAQTPVPEPEPVEDAPEAIDEENETGAEPNRYRRLFSGGLNFKVSDTDTVYTNDRDGSSSKKIANGVAIFVGGFAGVPLTVYAVKPKDAPAYAEVKFFGARMTSSITALDEQSKAELLEFRHFMAEQYILWRSGQTIATTPIRKSVGVPLGDAFVL